MTNVSVVEGQSVYRDILIGKRQELASSNRPLPLVAPPDMRHGDLVDQADGHNEVHIALKVRQTNAKIVRAIEEALTRIDEGTYGACGDCGEPIPPKRLNAVPWTRVCIPCKEKRRRQ